MKILFIGVLDIPWSSNTSMTKELRNLGHDVIDFNYRTISQNFFQNESLIKKNIEKIENVTQNYECVGGRSDAPHPCSGITLRKGAGSFSSSQIEYVYARTHRHM